MPHPLSESKPGFVGIVKRTLLVRLWAGSRQACVRGGDLGPRAIPAAD